MTAYYNENDPKAAAWLRELINAGHIADGIVDERSIEDVQPDELAGFSQCHFFAGIGGWSYALRLAGWPDDRPVWTGSCPCQPFSAAGSGKGAADDRHLWPVFWWLIAQCSPAVVFGEQVASATGRAWLAGVRADLETLGYAVGAADLCAAGVGAPHIRQRLFWVADANKAGRDRKPQCDLQPEARYKAQQRDDSHGCGAFRDESRDPWRRAHSICGSDGLRRIEPGIEPLADGVPGRVGLLRGYGNAIVPQVAAEFVRAFDGA